MTHIENIPHILQFGITHINSPNTNTNYKAIGDESLISKRNEFVLNNGKKLGEYIPFYFGLRTPMLYVIQKGYNSVKVTKAEHIVYIVTSVAQIIKNNLDFVFTDGHAIEAWSAQYYSKDIENLETILDFKALKDNNWIDPTDLDKKRRKQAELLVAGDVPKEAILGFFVYNEIAKQSLISNGVNENKAIVRNNYYF